MKAKNTTLKKLGAFWRWIVATLFGAALASLLFLVLPILQFVGTMGDDDIEFTEVGAVAEPPPPPPMEEPPPPDEPPPPEDQPQMDDIPQDMSLSALELSLNPGGGSGAAILQNVLTDSVQNRLTEAFAMSESTQRPRPVQQQSPVYPASLRRQGISGVVKVEMVVDARGRVVNPRVIESAHPAFNQPALEAIAQWRFEAGQRGGRKVPFKIVIPIRFSA